MPALALETSPAITSEGCPWDLSALALCGKWLEGDAASLPFCFSLLKGPQVVLCPVQHKGQGDHVGVSSLIN